MEKKGRRTGAEGMDFFAELAKESIRVTERKGGGQSCVARSRGTGLKLVV